MLANLASKIPFKLIVTAGLLVLAFLIGRCSAPTPEPVIHKVTKKEIVYKDKIVNVDKVITVYKKNGEKIVVRDKSNVSELQTTQKEKSLLDLRQILPNHRIAVKGNSINPTLSNLEVDYSYRIAGPVSLVAGATFDFKQIWVGGAIDF